MKVIIVVYFVGLFFVQNNFFHYSLLYFADRQKDLQFLKSHSEPFEEVKNAFNRTRDVRKYILSVQKISVFEYMLSIKAFRFDVQGKILVNIFLNDILFENIC